MTLSEHTFGGSPLDRYIYEFETTAEGGDAGTSAAVAEPAAAAAPTPAAAATDPAAATTDPPAAADAGTGAAGEGDFDETQFWSAVDDRVAETVHALVRSGQITPQQGQQAMNAAGDSVQAAGDSLFEDLDPLSEDFGAKLGQGIMAAMQQALNPFTSAVEQSQQEQLAEQGEQVLKDIIHDTIARGADLTDEGKQTVRPLVDIFFPAAAERFGAQNPRAAEVAAENAVSYVRSIEDAAAKRALEQHTNHLTTLATVSGEPAANGAAGVAAGQPAKYPSTGELISKYAPR